MTRVLITRKSREGRGRRSKRVYVTGPHFSNPPDYEGGTYSSTLQRDLATRYDRKTAERLLALGKWREDDPRIEEDG